MKKKQNHTTDSLEILEELTNEESIDADKSILEHAQEYHISLEDLEEISDEETGLADLPPPSAIAENVAESPQRLETSSTQHSNEKTAAPEDLKTDLGEHFDLQRIELPLREIIRKIFWRTSRPIVIISDDKIIYANHAFLALTGKDSDYDVVGKNFFEFVSPEYWSKVSDGIGDILVKNQAVQIGIKGKSGKVQRLNFEGIYISDEHTFSFVLLGILSEKKVYATGLYNESTGLPSYELLKDRIKMSISSRCLNSISLGQSISALACIHLETTDFMDDFRSMSMLKRIFERLLSSLNKHYTLAHGEEDKEFYIYIPKIENEEKLSTEMRYIKDLFETPVEENYSTTRFICTMGVSTYPEPATSAKKLVEEAKLAQIKATQKADGQIVYFGE